jgi:hypothetical protein
MSRLPSLFLVLGLSVSLLACGGDSCESLQEEFEEIGREIEANPETVLDRAEELQELGERMQEMGCVG